MFDSLRQNERPNSMRYMASLTISLIVHTAILGVLVVLPLVFLNSVQADEFLIEMILPIPKPVPPQAPAPPLTASAGSAARPVGSAINTDYAPPEPPVGIHPENDEPVILSTRRITEGIGGGYRDARLAEGISDLLAGSVPDVGIPPVPVIHKHPPVRVGGNVQESKLIRQVMPTYPPLAIKARVAGDVVLEALIDEEGNVTNLHVLKGHPLLNDAAIQAVGQWRYSPTILNGEPVQVIALVTVAFRLR